MRAIGRVDANQKDIVKLYRRCGCSVAITSNVGSGFPDIVVGKFGINEMVEIKDGAKPPSARRLTEHEARFKSKWRGTYTIIENDSDVLAHVESMRVIADALKARFATLTAGATIDEQIQEEINKIEWPDEESNRQKAVEQNGNDGYIYEKLAGLVK